MRTRNSSPAQSMAGSRRATKWRATSISTARLENFHCPLVQAERINAASYDRAVRDSVAETMPAITTPAWSDNGWSRPGCRIIIFQPSYAPHLNAIERLWGVMHREVTHNSFYASFALFTEAIDDFFRRRLPREWTTWRDTITDNFRIISHKDFRVLG